MEERQELNKPRDTGLETSPCFSWAESLLFIAAWGWGRALPVRPVTGVFGGDEPVPENQLREQLGSQGAGRGLGGQVQPASPDTPLPGRAQLRPLRPLPPPPASPSPVQRAARLLITLRLPGLRSPQ